MTRRFFKSDLALLAFALLLAPVPIQARVESATVAVDGMACPFCAFGVEKRLKRVGGVGSIEVNLGASSAALTASDGGSIDVSSIPEAIRKAGFTPGTIEVTAVGTISAEDSERLLFEVSGTDQEMLLVNLSGEIEKKSTEFAAAGVRVRVSGALHLHPEEPPGLEAVKIEAVE